MIGSQVQIQIIFLKSTLNILKLFIKINLHSAKLLILKSIETHAKNPLRDNMNNQGLVVSFIWKNLFPQSLGYILISIVIIILKRHSRSAEILVSVSV